MYFLVLSDGFSQGMDWAVWVITPGLNIVNCRGCKHMENVIQLHAEGKTLQPAAGYTDSILARNLGNSMLVSEHQSKVSVLENGMGWSAVGTIIVFVPVTHVSTVLVSLLPGIMVAFVTVSVVL